MLMAFTLPRSLRWSKCFTNIFTMAKSSWAAGREGGEEGVVTLISRSLSELLES